MNMCKDGYIMVPSVEGLIHCLFNAIQKGFADHGQLQWKTTRVGRSKMVQVAAAVCRKKKGWLSTTTEET